MSHSYSNLQSTILSMIIVSTHRNRYLDQWNKAEDTNMNECNYNHLTFDKDDKNTHWREESVLVQVVHT